jgi:hypothetical protein
MSEKSWHDLSRERVVFEIREATRAGTVLVMLRVLLLQSVCLCVWDVDDAAVVLSEYGAETCHCYVSLSGVVARMGGCGSCSSV